MTVRSDLVQPSVDDVGDAPVVDLGRPAERSPRQRISIRRSWIRAGEPPLTERRIGDRGTGTPDRRAA